MMHLPSVPRVWRMALSQDPHCTAHEKGTLTVPPVLQTNQCHSQYRHGKPEARVVLDFFWATQQVPGSRSNGAEAWLWKSPTWVNFQLFQLVTLNKFPFKPGVFLWKTVVATTW